MYVQHIGYETQVDVRTRDLAVIYGPENIVSLNGVPLHSGGPGSPITTGGTPEAVIQHLRSYYGATSSFESRAGTAEAQVESDRLVRAFAGSVNHEELESAADCWEWWINYQQVFAGEKPLNAESYEETWAVDRQRGYWVQVPDRLRFLASFSTVRAGGSCFAAGTPVVTEYGLKRIDEVRLGDRVLSQSVETGEIAFKPVLKTTVRPPVDFLRITTKSTELLCTPGHPFWVNDHDWLYARELAPGMRFHSLTGGEEITAVEDAARDEQAYNLIVGDFHTYFAGEARILSHDNTPRNPTNALVPGLMPDWTVPAEDDALADH